MNNSFSGTQIMSQQSGGFLNTSMAGGTQTGQFNNGMSNSEPCLLPCTIKQIKTAPLPSQDDPFRIDGRELQSITIVGRLVHVNVESTHASYIIDDGTGQLDVRIWRAADESKNDDYSDLKEEIYVRVIGKLKIYQENRSLTGYKISKIQDFNEITYHNLEVIFTHLKNVAPNRGRDIMNKNGNENMASKNNTSVNNSNNGFNVAGGTSGTGASNNNNNNNNSSVNNNNNGGGAGMIKNNNNNNNGGNSNNDSNSNNNDNNNKDDDDDANKSPLEIKVLTFLGRCEASGANGTNDSSYDGCHVDKIFQELADEDRNQIRELLEQMSTDGSIYTTIDDEHYRTAS